MLRTPCTHAHPTPITWACMHARMHARPPTPAARSPLQGVVPVGGAATLTLRACVAGGPGGSAEAVVSEQQGRLETVLILRVEGGNDIFLTLSGSYTPSCFGLGWVTLAALPRRVCSGPGRGWV